MKLEKLVKGGAVFVLLLLSAVIAYSANFYGISNGTADYEAKVLTNSAQVLYSQDEESGADCKRDYVECRKNCRDEKCRKKCKTEYKKCEKKEDKVTLCHIPPGDPSNAHTIRVSRSAVKSHLKHGDTLGECPAKPQKNISDIKCGDRINADFTLDRNLTCTGNGLIFNGSNISINCAGYNLTGDGTGEGISALNFTNITIRNCNIRNFARNINFTNVSDSLILNSNITNASGSAFPDGIGIFITDRSINITIQGTNSSNNSLFQLDVLFASHGLNVTGSFFSKLLEGNPDKPLIRVSNSSNISVVSNLIDRNSYGSVGPVIIFSYVNNVNLINNSGRLGGTSLEHFVSIFGTNNTIIESNRGGGTNVNAPYFNITGFSYNTSIINNSFSPWTVDIVDSNLTFMINQTVRNYSFTNAGFISFKNASAEIFFTNSSMTAAGNLSNELSLGFNRTFVNSAIRPGLNTTANITLFGLPFNDPQILVDLKDDGNPLICNENTDPKCEEINYIGGAFIFNVTHFTTFSSRNST